MDFGGVGKNSWVLEWARQVFLLILVYVSLISFRPRIYNITVSNPDQINRPRRNHAFPHAASRLLLSPSPAYLTSFFPPATLDRDALRDLLSQTSEHKRALADIDPDALPVSKHARRSPPLLPTPSTQSYRPPHRPCSPCFDNLDTRDAPPTKRRRLQSPRSEPSDDQHLRVTRSGSAPPWPTRAPGSKCCRPHLSTGEPINDWISAVCVHDTHSSDFPSDRPISPPSDRPPTCPATVNVGKGKRTPPSLARIKQMSQQPSQDGGNADPGSGTSQSGEPGTSHPLYRGTLYNNYITLDYSGRRMPKELRTFADEHILKQRESPQLGDEAVAKDGHGGGACR